jgi:glycine oxidase
VDVAIVGGGVIGLSSALRLAQAGARVVVIERGEVGREASWAAAGILGAQSEAQGPGPMLDFCLRSRALYPALAAELLERTGIDVGFRACGALLLADGDARAAELRRAHAWQTKLGLRAELQTALPDHPGTSVALFFSDDAQVDNRQLALALRAAIEKLGVTVHRARAARLLLPGGRFAGVETDSGAVAADRCVVAAGAWSAQLERSGLRGLRPVKGQMIAFDASPLRWTSVVFGGGGYAVPRPGGRLLVGATVEEAGFEAGPTLEGLNAMRQVAARLSPDLGRATPADHWAGLRPGTTDGLPIIGETAPGVLVATGHFRNGILLAPATAQAIVDLTVGSPREDLRAFAPGRSSLE